MTTDIHTKQNRFLQANLALVLAFIPSYLFFTFMPAHIIKIIDVWREGMHLSIRWDALFGVTLYFWLPALIIFLLMRHTHFEQWLKVNLLAQLSLLIANFFMLLVIGLIVYNNNHLYAFFRMRDQIFFATLTFAAVVTLGNMVWHYLVKPNPKLHAWLTDDIFTPLVK